MGVEDNTPYLVYECFVVYTDYTAVYWLSTIDEQSGLLTRWILLLAEFYFGDKHRKGKINAQADALYQLHMAGETAAQDKNDDIPVLKLDMINDELGLNRNPNEVSFIAIFLAAMDELYATGSDPPPTSFSTEPISIE